VSTGGALRLGQDGNGRLYGSAAVAQALASIVGGVRGTHLLEADVAAIARRSVDAEAALRTALRAPSDAAFGTHRPAAATTPATTPSCATTTRLTGAQAFNGLAQQLQVVARMIDAAQRGAVGVRRQVFFVSLGGFDTHDQQNRLQPT
jgi:uncharacterized protein (DUF1501 family)